MEIVIKIPEERFRDIQRIAEVQLECNHFKTAEQIIAKGTPLPKGRGSMDKTLEETLEEVKKVMCDDYCKYPDMKNDNEDWLFEKGSPCETCPLNRL